MRFRPLIAALMTFASIACTDPGDPELARSYELSSINGRSIPYPFAGPHFDIAPPCAGEFFKGSATFDETEEYEIHIHWVQQCGAVLTLDTLRYFGAYRLDPSGGISFIAHNRPDYLFEITDMSFGRHGLDVDAFYFGDVPFSFRFTPH